LFFHQAIRRFQPFAEHIIAAAEQLGGFTPDSGNAPHCWKITFQASGCNAPGVKIPCRSVLQLAPVRLMPKG
jgi:hypothetical protein